MKINDIEKSSFSEAAVKVTVVTGQSIKAKELKKAKASRRVEDLGLLGAAPLAAALKKRRGRPALGKPTPVVMDTHEEEIARQMGDGVKSLGVRMALRAVQMMGIKKARHLAAQYAVEPEKVEATPSSAIDIARSAGSAGSASTTVKHLIRKTSPPAPPPTAAAGGAKNTVHAVRFTKKS